MYNAVGWLYNLLGFWDPKEYDFVPTVTKKGLRHYSSTTLQYSNVNGIQYWFQDNQFIQLSIMEETSRTRSLQTTRAMQKVHDDEHVGKIYCACPYSSTLEYAVLKVRSEQRTKLYTVRVLISTQITAFCYIIM